MSSFSLPGRSVGRSVAGARAGGGGTEMRPLHTGSILARIGFSVHGVLTATSVTSMNDVKLIDD